jgi:hypothetical protein
MTRTRTEFFLTIKPDGKMTLFTYYNGKSDDYAFSIHDSMSSVMEAISSNRAEYPVKTDKMTITTHGNYGDVPTKSVVSI